VDWVEIISIIFYSSSAGLLLFYVFVYNKFSNHKPSSARFEKLPFVSVIICARNECENIKKFLPTILSQKYPDFEVLVVNDDSKDGTMENLADLAIKFPKLKVVDFKEEKISKGKKQVLEFGISKAKGEYLVMTDADCKAASPFWLVGMVNGFANNSDLVLGIGMYDKKKGWLNKLIQLDTLFIITQYISFSIVGFPYMSVGRNVAYKKSLFQQIGGFKNHYDIAGGDDDLLINEMDISTTVNVVYNPSAQTISVPETSWKCFIDQKSRHISAGVKYNNRNLCALGLLSLFVMFWYASLPLMICYSDELAIVLTIGVLKNISLYTIIRRIFAKIGVAELILLSIFMDIVSIFVQIMAIINSLKRKEAKW